MQPRLLSLALAAGLLAGCGQDRQPVAANQDLAFGPASGLVAGTVYGFIPPRNGSDSVTVPLAGVRVTAYRLGDLPRDSVPPPPPPDSQPNDSTPPPPPPDSLAGAGGFVLILVDTLPTDTMPPPPPPDTGAPPPSRCEGGVPLARGTTGADGSFVLHGLPAGVYLLRAVPGADSRFGRGQVCGFPLAEGQELRGVRISLPLK